MPARCLKSTPHSYRMPRHPSKRFHPMPWRSSGGSKTRCRNTPGWSSRPMASCSDTPTAPSIGRARRTSGPPPSRSIRTNARGNAVGRALYTALLDLLRRQGYFNAYAGITLPNPGSVHLHESMGFTPVGVCSRVGFKLGRWHDVLWLHLRLSEEPRHWANRLQQRMSLGTQK